MNHDRPTVTLAPREEIIARMISADDAERQAADLDALAVGRDLDKDESFERCDTDGFVSQWAHGLNAQRHRFQASILRNGGRWEFPALFTLDGRLIDARLIDTRRIDARFGPAWLTSDGEWINNSTSEDPNRIIKTNAAKGVYAGTISAPARAEHRGGSMVSVNTVIERADDRSWDDAIIVDNGHTITTVPTPAQVAQGQTCTDQPWYKPLCASSIDYVNTPNMVTAVYVADPGADPATAADTATYTPFWQVPRARVLGTAVKYTKATSPTGATGWHVTDTKGEWTGHAFPRKTQAMAALTEAAVEAIEQMARDHH